MLSISSLREHRRWVMGFVLILIIPAFIALYGIGGGGGGGRRGAEGPKMWAAQVSLDAIGSATTEILETDFWRARRNQVERLRAQRGENWQVYVTEEELSKQLLDSMIDQELIKQYARKHGITTSDYEVGQEIASLDQFKTNGKFDEGLYFRLLRANGWTEPYYIELVRDNLTQRKVQEAITAGVQVSPQEVFAEFERRNARVEAEYLAFESDAFGRDEVLRDDELQTFLEAHRSAYRLPDRVGIRFVQIIPRNLVDQVEVTEEEIEDYFNAHRDQFKLKPTARADFLTISLDPFLASVIIDETDAQNHFDLNADRYVTAVAGRMRYVFLPLDAQVLGVTITEDQIRKQYDENPSRYEVPEGVRLRHILVKVDQDAPEPVAEQAKTKLADVRRQILDGTLSFADAVDQYSEDTGSIPNDGVYDYAPKGTYDKPFDDRAWSLPVGELSEPFKTTYGYHLLEVLDRRPKGRKPFEEVRKEIEDQLLQEEMRRVARERLEQLRDRIGDHLDAQTAGPEWLVVETARPFSADSQAIEGFGNPEDVPMVASRVIQMASGEISDVLVGARHMYLCQLIEKLDPRPMTYVEAREKVFEDLRRERAREQARTQAYQVYNELVSGASIAVVAASHSLVLHDSKVFAKEYDPHNRLQPVLQIDGISAAAQATFKDAVFAAAVGSAGGPILDEEKGFHVFVVREKTDERLPELDEVRSRVRGMVAQDNAVEHTLSVAEDLLYHATQNNTSLEQAAAALLASSSIELQVQTSSLFGKEDQIPEIGYRMEIVKAAFSLTHEGDLYEAPIPVYGRNLMMSGEQKEQLTACYVIELATRSVAHDPQLDEVRDQVVQHLRRQKGAERAREAAHAAETALARALQEKAFPPADTTRSIDLRAFARSIDAKYQEPVEFTQAGYVPNLGNAPAFARTGFSLGLGQVSGVIEVMEKIKDDFELPKGYYLLQVIRRTEADRTEFDKQKEDIRKQLVQSRQNVTFRSWLNGLREHASVKINEDVLQPPEERREDEETEETPAPPMESADGV